MDKAAKPARSGRLAQALHRARIEEAERTDVIVQLHAVELARLDLLREALVPVFAEIPEDALQFDLALQRGDPPRLWIDMVAHVTLERDRQTYCFVQDTSRGRRILFESADTDAMAERITAYVAQRLVEREKALASDRAPTHEAGPHRRWGALLVVFLLGVAVGALALLLVAWSITAPR